MKSKIRKFADDYGWVCRSFFQDDNIMPECIMVMGNDYANEVIMQGMEHGLDMGVVGTYVGATFIAEKKAEFISTEGMSSWFFTFGTNHETTSGIRMVSKYVRVIVKQGTDHQDRDEFTRARLLFIEMCSSQYMSVPDKWSFQYSEDEWLNGVSSWYPYLTSEFMTIMEEVV